MKAPRFIAHFVNWVEGDEVLSFEEKPARALKKRSPKKTAAPKKHPVNGKIGKTADILYKLLAVCVCIIVFAALLRTVSWLPEFGSSTNPEENEVYERYVEDGLAEAGAVNTVAGMILDYRAFDTLGESNVLFIAVCSVVILLRADRDGKTKKLNIPALESEPAPRPDDSILRCAAFLLVPVGVLFGIYVILNGHLSAGGGFSGGAVIGGALILYANAFGPEKLEKFFTFSTYKWITFGALITYTLLKSYSFYTGANHMESIIPLGKPGAILSSGLILPLNVCVGLVVACTMYAFYSLFSKGGFGDGQ